MKFKPYPKYVDSGVEWLGEIPEGWAEMDVKFASSIELSNVDKHTVEGEPEAFLCNYTDVYNNSVLTNGIDYLKATASKEQLDRLQLCEGDVIITKDSETPDDIGIPALVVDTQLNLVCGYHLALIRPDSKCLVGGYLAWFCRSKNAKSYFEIEAVGMTRYGLGKYSIANQPIPLPPLSTQQAISSFLDSSTARIDSLVQDYEALIALLQEKRQALISHAVTRGLSGLVCPDDPDFGEWAKPVKFVDSGVEWLGEIPEGWKVTLYKRELSFITSGSRGWAEYYSDEGSVFLRIGNLTRDTISLDYRNIQRVTVPQNAESERTKVERGDVLFSITADIGSVAVVDDASEPMYINQHIALTRLRKNSRLLPSWIAYSVFSDYGQSQLSTKSYGGTKIQLSLDDVKEIFIAYPPISEQSTILSFLSRETAKIDALVKETRDAIELLKEHRAALITNAVTGKINVEEWAEA